MALLTQRKVCLVGHILYEKYVKKNRKELNRMQLPALKNCKKI